MMHFVRSAVIVFVITFITMGAAHAQASRSDFCLSGANAMLRQRVDPAAAAQNQLVMQCLCTVDPDAIKGYMNWCMTRATDQDLASLAEQIKSSPCATQEAMQNCVR